MAKRTVNRRKSMRHKRRSHKTRKFGLRQSSKTIGAIWDSRPRIKQLKKLLSKRKSRKFRDISYPTYVSGVNHNKNISLRDARLLNEMRALNVEPSSGRTSFDPNRYDIKY